MSDPTQAFDASSAANSAPPTTYETSHYRRRARLTTTVTIVITLVLLIASTTLVILLFLNDDRGGPSSSDIANAYASAGIAQQASDTASSRVDALARLLNAELSGTGGISSPGNGEQAIASDQQLALATEVAKSTRDAATQAQTQATELRREAQDAGEIYNRRWIGYWVVYGAFVLVTIAVATATISYSQQEARRQFQNEQLEKRLDEVANDFKLVPLLRHNRSQLLGYHTIVRNFAASSRQLAIRTIAAGFGFILLVSIATLFVNGTAGAIAASVVAASAAALTGFIGTAIIKNTATSSKELIAFFRHPIDTERVLTAERLIDSLPDDSKAEATMLLIKYLAGNLNQTQSNSESATP